MRIITVTQTNVGVTDPVTMDHFITPFNVGFGVVPTSGINYTVQHSFDNPLVEGYNANTATWYDHPTAENQIVKQDGNYAFPVAAIRLKVNSGTGSATLTLIQAGAA